MGSEHLQKLDVSWGHEPGRRLQSGTGFQPVSLEQAGRLCHFMRFMGSFHDLTIAHWDHEPLRLTEARSGPRVCDP